MESQRRLYKMSNLWLVTTSLVLYYLCKPTGVLRRIQLGLREEEAMDLVEEIMALQVEEDPWDLEKTEGDTEVEEALEVASAREWGPGCPMENGEEVKESQKDHLPGGVVVMVAGVDLEVGEEVDGKKKNL